ncbi:MAG: hypothetical protein ACE5JR_00185 [Gemmatimonadota bacterium]
MSTERRPRSDSPRARRPPSAGKPRVADAAGAAERAPFLGLRMANAALLLAAVVVIAAGYLLLDRGSITAAPILLVLGYAVLLPAGLLVGFRRERAPEE